MTITYPLTLPNLGIARIEMRGIERSAISASPFTGSQQVMKHSGQWWEADVTLPPLKRDEAEIWIAFLLSLRGHYGTFTMGDPMGATPQGSASTTPGTPLVNGASQTGATLTIDGCPASATGYLKAGDYIQLGYGTSTRLHKVVADVDTDASGGATLDIWPSIRTAPADNATVIVSNTVGL